MDFINNASSHVIEKVSDEDEAGLQAFTWTRIFPRNSIL